MSLQKPIIVRKVSIKGNNRTKLSFFDNEINDTLNVSSIDELSRSLDILHNNLVSKGLFDSIDINVEEIKKNSNDSDTTPIEINIKVIEKGIPFLKMESFVKQQNGSSNVGCEIQGNIYQQYNY